MDDPYHAMRATVFTYTRHVIKPVQCQLRHQVAYFKTVIFKFNRSLTHPQLTEEGGRSRVLRRQARDGSQT